MMSIKSGVFFLFFVLLLSTIPASSQVCTGLGQTPSSAFPVCGTTTFLQSTVPLCGTLDVFVPGCGGGAGTAYQNRNPYYYKFTCFEAGTLGFLVTPLAANEDYDWQLWDITGRNPDDVFNDPSLVVTGNWAGTYGPTGTSANGSLSIQCGSDPAANITTFARRPDLIVGHEYLLMISHFTNGQSGYSLSFGGGTAVITDPNDPHLGSVKTDCDGLTLTVKLNKKMKCSSLTATGSEFSLVPANTTVVSATTTTCTNGFDLDELTLTLASPLPAGNYQLVINDGSDVNSLLDNCDRAIPGGEQIPFTYIAPVPIFADSIARVGCAPNSIRVYFPKNIDCSTIAPDGSDFSVAGPSPVTVISANGNCANNETGSILVTFAAPIVVKGTYVVTLKTGVDGTTIVDECGLELPTQTLNFQAVDTVSAEFTFNTQFECRTNTVTFTHDGAHDVNSWRWTVNDTIKFTTRTHTMVFPATSNNNVKLIVSNGVCSDSTTQAIVMDNEVKASFEMPDVICPEDLLTLVNTSTGLIDTWRWTFDALGTSSVKTPTPFLFPSNNRESFYNIKLVATNFALACSDSMRKRIRVLNNCFIAVPSAFTPNGDGLNDFLYPNNAIKADNLDFRVYNRWGQLVFHSRDWTKKWDGKIGGIPQGAGVFVWYLSYTLRDTNKKVFQKGTTTLIN